MSATTRETFIKKRRGRKAKAPAFIMLQKWMLDTEAWRALSLPARGAIIELLHIYNGVNNGNLGMSVRRLAERLGCSKATASRVLIELEDVGFIDTVHLGSFTRKQRRASEYRLTWLRCDLTGKLPSKRFMQYIPCSKKQRTVSSERQKEEVAAPECPNDLKQAKASDQGLARSTPVGVPHMVNGPSCWTTPTLVEVFPSPETIALLGALYHQQAEEAGEPNDFWRAPPGPVERTLRSARKEAA
jgi:hypothetical protein